MLSSKGLGMLAILAVICFAALIALQVLELMYYGADPSVWPLVP